jgi:hypothetical protein
MPLLKNWPSLGGPGRMIRPFPVGDESPSITTLTPNAGPTTGGTTVVITGKNFIAGGDSSNITVTFDGQPATGIVIVDRQTISCATPQFVGTGPVDVAVTVGSKIVTLAGGFIVYEVIVTGVSPSNGPYSGGTSVLISGYNFKLGSTVAFGGVAATDVVWIDAEHIRCTTPSHVTGFVDVAVTEP